MKPVISVIVPVYNAEAFLRECIESVMAQSLADWELLLVDDGSTDSSSDICRSYASREPRIKVISKPNGGVSSARNAGIDHAEGDYIFFIDADDEIYPDTLSSLLKIAVEYDVPIVVGRYINAPIKPSQPHEAPDILPPTRLIDSRQLCADSLYQQPGTDTCVWAHLYRRSLFEGLRFPEGRRYEDLEIFHKLLMRTQQVAVTDKLIYFYRDHTSSFINTWSEARKDIVGVTREIVDTYRDDDVLYRAARVRHFSANYNLLLALLRYRPDRQEEITRCFAEIRSLRRTVLLDPRCRRKDRVGALLSYMGLRFIKYLS